MSEKEMYVTEESSIVTLKSQTGEDIEFTEIAGIALRGKFYAILQPIVLLEGMDEDEALVFEVSRGEEGEDCFNLVLDDEIIDEVFAEYERLFEQLQNGENN